jgi:phytoene dehydrogenase-like protein
MAQEARVAVVGAGVAGLCAAAFAARAGARVTVFERLSESGGRARTRTDDGFAFNMGPHALYLEGPAIRALRELGIEPAGNAPATSGGFGWLGGRLHALPAGAVSLMTTGLLGVADKLELAGLLSRVARLEEHAGSAETVDEFFAREIRSERVRGLLRAFVRTTSYSAMTDRIAARPAIVQVARGLGAGVRYLDHGWQSLVDALERRALEAGAELRRSVKVERVTHDGTVRGIELAGGERCAADAVILAGGPEELRGLVDDGRHPVFTRALEKALPVRAACLDLGLSSLPNPKHLFTMGIDRPLYYSVHSAAAKLAPEGQAAVCLVRYLRAEERPTREELEADFHPLLDALQPGWRERVVTHKLLRELVVSHDLPQAALGGLSGRTPGPVSGIANLHLAGDWIGPEGMLADAAFASAKAAARAAAGARGVRVAA